MDRKPGVLPGAKGILYLEKGAAYFDEREEDSTGS